MSNSLCLVCGDVASRKHYGVKSCISCKRFFGNTVKRGLSYQCPLEATCLITKDNKNNCAACHFQKCVNVGMCRTAIPSSGRNNNRVCCICGAAAISRNFGVISCEACKGFFRKTVQNSISYQCQQNENCKISQKNRIKCPACRHKKCLALGMRKEGHFGKNRPRLEKKKLKTLVSVLKNVGGRLELGRRRPKKLVDFKADEKLQMLPVVHLRRIRPPWTLLCNEDSVTSVPSSAEVRTSVNVAAYTSMTSELQTMNSGETEMSQPIVSNASVVEISSDRVRRALFKNNQQTHSETEDDCKRSSRIKASKMSCVSRPSESADDAAWRRDIWRSYGSRTVRLPSPACRMPSPSRIFADSDDEVVRSSSPETLSSSSDDEPWGPDSPDNQLVHGSFEGLPGCPVFADRRGQPLNPCDLEWQVRLQQWQSARTSPHPRSRPKRRYHCRSRRAWREEYAGKMAAQSDLVIDWSSMCIRPLDVNDVRLPSPSSDVELDRERQRLISLQRRMRGRKK